MNQLEKRKVHSALVATLKQKISLLESELVDMNESLLLETKGSAGDKHETSRAQVHIEQERIGNQLAQHEQSLELMRTILPSENHTTIQQGSLVETEQGWFYLSAGGGMISVEDQKVFCLTTLSPLGSELLGKKAKDSVQLNGNTIKIKSVI